VTGLQYCRHVHVQRPSIHVAKAARRSSSKVGMKMTADSRLQSGLYSEYSSAACIRRLKRIVVSVKLLSRVSRRRSRCVKRRNSTIACEYVTV
jgi:hypothetical protein